MAQNTSLEAVLPYLNPDYWGGHSIGYGDITRDTLGHDRGAINEAKVALRERLAFMERALPLETYNDGQVFDASSYTPGTIVIFRDEVLRGNPRKLDVDIASLKGQPLPPRPFDVSPSFGDAQSTSEAAYGGKSIVNDVSYFTAARWGIIGVNRARKREVYAISTGLVEKVGPGRVALRGATLHSYPPKIEIGKVDHTRSKYGENVKRVNILEVLALGKTEPERAKARGFFTRLILNPAKR